MSETIGMTAHKTIPLIIVPSILCFSPAALAYLDPGTGSMVISAIVGLFASAVLVVKTYWYKIRAFFRGDKKVAEEPASAADGTTAEKDP